MRHLNVCSMSEMRNEQTWDPPWRRTVLPVVVAPSLSAWQLKVGPLMGWMWSRWIGKQRFNLSHWRFPWSLLKCLRSGMSIGELGQRAVCTNTARHRGATQSNACWNVIPLTLYSQMQSTTSQGVKWTNKKFPPKIPGSFSKSDERFCGSKIFSLKQGLGNPRV